MTRLPHFLAIDFFCGAGGATQGLIDAGGYVIAGIDRDDSYRYTYQSNNRNQTLDRQEPAFLAQDMLPATPDFPQGQQLEILNALDERIPQYRELASGVPLLFVVCAPCQSFTTFVQRHLTDQRTQDRERELDLLAQTLPFVERFQPELILSENVAHIRSGPYREVWHAFRDELRLLGYAVGDGRVCAAHFGVPQNRRRSILLAAWIDPGPTGGLGLNLELAIPDNDPAAPRMSVQAAIGHLPPLQAGQRCTEIANHVCRSLSATNRQRLMSVKPGESNDRLAESPFGDLSLPCHRRLVALGRRGFGDVYTRMRPDVPAPTLTTRFDSVSNGRFGHFDESQVRGLSLSEGAILQSFRENYTFFASNLNAIARMIGNAVPPRMTSYLATWLLRLWRDKGGYTRAGPWHVTGKTKSDN